MVYKCQVFYAIAVYYDYPKAGYSNLKPEESTKKMEAQLEATGWLVQDYSNLNLVAGIGVAVREFPLKGAGFADYLLFVDRQAVGVIEAKPEGTTLKGSQSKREVPTQFAAKYSSRL